ncbi:ABC transporter ATP-binding protein [Patescibacteria group bacterium]
MKPLAIKITNLSKDFRIPAEKRRSLRQRFASLKFKSNHHLLSALKNINLKIETGEWIGIIGQNGSGKSTLLKLISDIYESTKGSLSIAGKVVPFLELGVGFNPELSASDNIYLNGTILGMTKKGIRKKFNSIVNFAEIKPFINMKLKNFSSGMKLRIGFAIAIQAPGDIYLLDEVLAVGDYRFQQKTKHAFNRLKKSNKTAVFVSHDLNQIKQFCDRVIWLDKGRIVKSGHPSTVIKAYIKKNS